MKRYLSGLIYFVVYMYVILDAQDDSLIFFKDPISKKNFGDLVSAFGTA